ncbi:MAG: helix-turn-helix domain-containing protein [archaeon]
MEGLVVVREDTLTAERAEIVDTPDKLRLALHPQRIEILKALGKKPMYVADLIKRTGVSEQKTYYHLGKLVETGLLDIVETRQVRGALAKKYAPKALNLCLLLDRKRTPASELLGLSSASPEKSIFSDLAAQDPSNIKIVVGTPDPHGPYKARSRDGHYGIELAFHMGNIMPMPPTFSVVQDVDQASSKGNLIIVGGPVTNLVYARFNPHFKVKFTKMRPFEIFSELSGKSYADDNIGCICRIPHPEEPGRSVIAFAGISLEGTRAAVLALTRHQKQVLGDFKGQEEWYRVVEGFDLDGDGKIDSVEVLE